jgi:hypothetical protein
MVPGWRAARIEQVKRLDGHQLDASFINWPAAAGTHTAAPPPLTFSFIFFPTLLNHRVQLLLHSLAESLHHPRSIDYRCLPACVRACVLPVLRLHRSNQSQVSLFHPRSPRRCTRPAHKLLTRLNPTHGYQWFGTKSCTGLVCSQAKANLKSVEFPMFNS